MDKSLGSLSRVLPSERNLAEYTDEIRRLAHELAFATARRLSVTQHVVDVIITTDFEGKIIGWNNAGEKMFGYTKEEMLGKFVSIIIPERLSGKNTEVLEHLLQDRKGDLVGQLVEVQGVAKTGQEIPLELSLSVWDIEEDSFSTMILRDISERKIYEEERGKYIKRLEDSLMGTVNAIMTMSNLRDPYTVGHEWRVAEIAVAIAKELGFDVFGQRGILIAGRLHDVGKIIVPSEILSKPGELTAIEFELIKQHVNSGYNILKDVDFEWPVALIVLQHHERMDGSGYPQGLMGDQISFEARIMMVADVVEAMSSHRPYRPSLGIEAALKEIEDGAGTRYDSRVSEACLLLFREKGYVLPQGKYESKK